MHEEVAVYQNKTRRGRLKLLVLLGLCLGGVILGKFFWRLETGSLRSVTLGQESFEEIEALLDEEPHSLLVKNTRGYVVDTIFSLEEYRKLFFEGGIAHTGKGSDVAIPTKSSGELDPIVQLGNVSETTKSEEEQIEPEPLKPVSNVQVFNASLDSSKPSEKPMPPVPSSQTSRSLTLETEGDLKEEAGKSTASLSQAHNLTETPITALPEFPGGMNALTQYISEQAQYPARAKANQVSGVVYVSFLVSQTGEVKSPKIIRGLGYDCDKEVLRLLSSMPAWKAARYKGEPIEMSYTLSIPFKPSD